MVSDRRVALGREKLRLAKKEKENKKKKKRNKNYAQESPAAARTNCPVIIGVRPLRAGQHLLQRHPSDILRCGCLWSGGSGWPSPATCIRRPTSASDTGNINKRTCRVIAWPDVT